MHFVWTNSPTEPKLGRKSSRFKSNIINYIRLSNLIFMMKVYLCKHKALGPKESITRLIHTHFICIGWKEIRTHGWRSVDMDGGCGYGCGMWVCVGSVCDSVDGFVRHSCQNKSVRDYIKRRIWTAQSQNSKTFLRHPVVERQSSSRHAGPVSSIQYPVSVRYPQWIYWMPTPKSNLQTPPSSWGPGPSPPPTLFWDPHPSLILVLVLVLKMMESSLMQADSSFLLRIHVIFLRGSLF